MTTPHPDSPRALAEASLWRHMNGVSENIIDGIREEGIQFSKSFGTFYVLCILLCLWPISFPIIAWLRRRKYRKEVSKWEKNK